MAHVSLRHKNETFDGLLRRWKNAVEESDILKTLRKYEAFERPGDKRKRKAAAAMKREERRRQELETQRTGIRPPQPKKKARKSFAGKKKEAGAEA